MVEPDEFGGSAVRYPDMRRELILGLQEFADPAYQQRAWIDRDIREGTVAGFEVSMTGLFDDLSLGDADQRQFIGVWLVDEREADAVAEFAAVFNYFWWPLEPELSDAEIVSRPGWCGVVDAARAALRVLAPEMGFAVEF